MSSSRSRDVRNRIQKHAEEAKREFQASLDEASNIKKAVDPVRPVALSPCDVRELQQKYEDQNRSCPLCGHALVFGQHERDHIVPISKGGATNGQYSTGPSLVQQKGSRTRWSRMTCLAIWRAGKGGNEFQ